MFPELPNLQSCFCLTNCKSVKHYKVGSLDKWRGVAFVSTNLLTNRNAGIHLNSCSLIGQQTFTVRNVLGHENFSESTEEKKPLSEDEKKEQLAKIEAKLKQRRTEREEREKQEALEREKKRIRSGKDMLEAKKKQEDLEIKKIVEQRKREKEEERLARQRVKDQIEQDKLARRAKFSGGAAVDRKSVV